MKTLEIINKTEAWLKDPSDYSEGLRLLRPLTVKWRLYGRLIKSSCPGNQRKLKYELRKALIRFKIENIGIISESLPAAVN